MTPDVRIYTLDNGCKVLVRPTPGKEILSIVADVAWGARDDHPDRTGLTGLMTRLLVKGADGRSAFEVAERLESVGASLEPYCSHDSCGLDAQCASEDWRLAFEVLTDCLFAPNLAESEFEHERALAIAELRRADDDKFSLTYRKFLELFYRGHFYATMPEGDVETVEQLTLAEVRALHARVVRPDSVLLTVVGNLPEDELLAEIQKRWPARPVEAMPERRLAVRKPGAGMGETLLLTKEAEQAFVIQGYLAARLGSPDSAPLRLVSAILGEGMSARLFARLRDRDHLAYAVGTSLAGREACSHLILYIGTSPATAQAAREGLLRETAGLLTEPLSEEEFERARRYVLGKYLIARQTNNALAHSMLAGERLGLGWEWGEHLPDRMKVVTRSQVLDVAQRYLTQPATAILHPAAGAFGDTLIETDDSDYDQSE
ncbi:MAG TPA: pitrilysin family protein [Candidatus Sumerlaeota bacterium]|nr:pitrilysin family protein [Candidatus Sumerlaeota bacterium]HPS02749.1 pitrilysin family protein [Candidatus Sumerlaeota bacterium]